MLTEKDLEHELQKQIALTAEFRGPVLDGLSRFAHQYVSTYCRGLPDGLLYDDVRASVEVTHGEILFLKYADDSLPWASFHFFFNKIAVPALVRLGMSKTDIENVLGVPSGLLFQSVAKSRICFWPFQKTLSTLEDERLAEGMEELFMSVDKGLFKLYERNSARFVVLLQATRFFYNLLMNYRSPEEIGTFFAVAHTGFGAEMEGSTVLCQLKQSMERALHDH